MYSWERDYSGHKYESIQEPYYVEDYLEEDELEAVEVSLDEMLELADEEIEMEEMEGAY